MNILKTLEQQYQFQYPELYHRLYADQMLDIGEYASHWSKEVYPPPLHQADAIHVYKLAD